MASLNTSQNGSYISTSYQKVVSSPHPVGPAASSSTYAQWALYSVQAPLVSAFQSEAGKESVLKVQTTGEGELVDLVEEFNDGRIQFAFVKVKDPNTALPKCVLIAWCGEGVPERTKGYFTSHMNVVSKILHGYHVQITARSDGDLTPDSIVRKVADASGSKYGGGNTALSAAASGPPPPVKSKPVMPTKSFGTTGSFQPLGSRAQQSQSAGNVDADGWGEDAPPVMRSQLEKVESAYKPTKVDMNSLQAQREPSRYQASPSSANGGGDMVRGGYQPVGKVDITAIKQQAEASGSTQDDRPTVVKGAYEPVGKVDIAEIRRKAQGASSPAPQPVAPQFSGGEEDRQKSLADRSATFQQGGRLTSLPKPSVSNRFGSQTSFTGTKAPQPSGFEAKAPAPSAAPVGAASKTFADEGGKTPAQVWAEKKARERGMSGGAEIASGHGQSASTTPIQAQPSGGWQSAYGGKKWDVNIPTRARGGSLQAQSTGQSTSGQADESSPSGVGSVRDRFQEVTPAEPPPLDTSSKPNASRPGMPIPGLPQRSTQNDIPDYEHQDLPPPPPRGVPAEEAEDDEIPQSQGSPVRIARPVGRNSEPDSLEKADDLPEQGLPIPSLEKSISQHREPLPEPQAQSDIPGRGAGIAAAEATFGHATDPRGAGSSGGREAIAQYDYERAEENELELQDGERITNIDMVDEDWWMGQNSRGEVGLFPANYVELVPDSSAVPAGSGASADSGPPTHATAGDSTSAAPSAIAQYDYQAGEDNEISFPDGATIENIVRSSCPKTPKFLTLTSK